MNSQFTLNDDEADLDSGQTGMNKGIFVCSLNRVDATLEKTRASHLITLINHETMIDTPDHLDPDNHLKLAMNDIVRPMPELVMPNEDHVSDLLDFAGNWDRNAPMVIHCWAGISRSTAAAYIVQCALNPDTCEKKIADLLRASSPSATPNILLVSHADTLLDRDGRMVAAIESIGIGELAFEGRPFGLPHKFAG